MNIYLEIFGYCGTALVLISMMMTSVIKLRWFNAAGSLISIVYAYFTNTWPVLVLNLCLLIINVLQLIRLSRVKVSFDYTQLAPADGSLRYFLRHYEKDIKQFFPEFDGQVSQQSRVYMVYRNADPAGVLIGTAGGEGLFVELDYTTPQYRDCSVAAFLFEKLKDEGIGKLIASSDTPAHYSYLQKMGFVKKDSQWEKTL